MPHGGNMMRLDESRKHPRVIEQAASFHAETVKEVSDAVATHDVVMVSMAQNPFPKKARKILDEKGVKFHELSYGSYMSKWKERLAIKLWAGWPTIPMIFVKGTFIGGSTDLQALVDSGEFDELLTR